MSELVPLFRALEAWEIPGFPDRNLRVRRNSQYFGPFELSSVGTSPQSHIQFNGHASEPGELYRAVFYELSELNFFTDTNTGYNDSLADYPTDYYVVELRASGAHVGFFGSLWGDYADPDGPWIGPVDQVPSDGAYEFLSDPWGYCLNRVVGESLLSSNKLGYVALPIVEGSEDLPLASSQRPQVCSISFGDGAFDSWDPSVNEYFIWTADTVQWYRSDPIFDSGSVALQSDSLVHPTYTTDLMLVSGDSRFVAPSRNILQRHEIISLELRVRGEAGVRLVQPLQLLVWPEIRGHRLVMVNDQWDGVISGTIDWAFPPAPVLVGPSSGAGDAPQWYEAAFAVEDMSSLSWATAFSFSTAYDPDGGLFGDYRFVGQGTVGTLPLPGQLVLLRLGGDVTFYASGWPSNNDNTATLELYPAPGTLPFSVRGRGKIIEGGPRYNPRTQAPE